MAFPIGSFNEEAEMKKLLSQSMTDPVAQAEAASKVL